MASTKKMSEQLPYWSGTPSPLITISPNRDLGTYHLRVEFENARGFIESITTGWRFSDGDSRVSPMTATAIRPTWENEEDMIGTQIYMWTEGNDSCDCNRRLLIARAHHEPEPTQNPCGETIQLKRLTLIRPNMTEKEIWPKK